MVEWFVYVREVRRYDAHPVERAAPTRLPGGERAPHRERPCRIVDANLLEVPADRRIPRVAVDRRHMPVEAGPHAVHLVAPGHSLSMQRRVQYRAARRLDHGLDARAFGARL